MPMNTSSSQAETGTETGSPPATSATSATSAISPVTADEINLTPGYTFVSAGRTITEHDVVTFAGLSGDFNQIHVNHEFASQTRFGRRIAHGLLTLSILSGLTTQSLEYRLIEPSVVALLDIQCRFPKPTFIGDTIISRVTVTEKIPDFKKGCDRITFRREAVNQRGEVTVQADFVMLIRSRRQSA